MWESVGVQSSHLPLMELCRAEDCVMGTFAGGQAGGQLPGGEN